MSALNPSVPLSGITWLDVLIYTGAALLALGVLWKTTRAGTRFLRAMGRVADAVLGDPEADPPRPSALDRLTTVERHTAQLLPNGGTSLADQVRRLTDSVHALRSDQAESLRRSGSEEGRRDAQHRDLRHEVASLRTMLVLHMHETAQVTAAWREAFQAQGVTLPPPVISPPALDIADAISAEVESSDTTP